MNLIYTLLAVNTSQPLPTLTDKFLYGGEILLIGMATIFAVLTLLLIILSLFKSVFALFGKERASQSAQAPAHVVTQTVVSGDNDEIVAVIAAAIAMAENESNGLKFRVVSFKRK